MQPEIIERGPTMLAGMVFYGDPFAGGEGWSSENEYGKTKLTVWPNRRSSMRVNGK